MRTDAALSASATPSRSIRVPAGTADRIDSVWQSVKARDFAYVNVLAAEEHLALCRTMDERLGVWSKSTTRAMAAAARARKTLLKLQGKLDKR